MKLKILIFIILFPLSLVAQNTLDGNAKFGSQADINAFDQNIVKVTGKIQIYGNDINDLSPLANIDSVMGKFEVFTTDILIDFEGMNLKYVGSNVYLGGNKMLSSLSGLESLKHIGKDLAILDCGNLSNLDGLSNLDSIIGSIYIGTEAWKTPPGNKGNKSLLDFCGLSNLLQIGGLKGNYFIDFNAYNPILDDFASGNCNGELSFDGNLKFGTQEAIDTVDQRITKVTGKLQIYGESIKDLSPLANIDSVMGKFEVFTTDSLEDFEGMNLEYVGSNVYLAGNKMLSSLSGFDGIKYIGKDLAILDCGNLSNLDGLSNVDSIIGSIYIGTEAWKTPPGEKGNNRLLDYCGLSNVVQNSGLKGNYFVDFNAYNPTFDDLISGKCGGELIFEGNLSLGTQEAIDTVDQRITKVTGKLQIYGESIKDLSPLANIDSVMGKFEVFTTDSLEDFEGMNLKYVGSNVFLGGNKMLGSLAGLESLTYIGKDLAILDCDTLVNLDGLANVDSIIGSIYIGTEAWKTPPGEKGNSSLSDLCGLSNVIINFGLIGEYHVEFNAYNPTVDDIVAGNCNLTTSVSNLDLHMREVITYYNHGHLRIKANQDEAQKIHISVYSITGQLIAVFKDQFFNGYWEKSLNLKENTIYISKIQIGQSVYASKFFTN